MTAEPQRRGTVGRQADSAAGMPRRIRRARRFRYPAAVLAAGLMVVGAAAPVQPARRAVQFGAADAAGTAPRVASDAAVGHPSATLDADITKSSANGSAARMAFWPRATETTAGIPATVLDAYRRAEAATASTDPGCHLSWPLLAGIGKVESGHARGGNVAPNGDLLAPILGPPLDGSAGTAAIPNSGGAEWGQIGQWTRAVGSMQFLPGTWRKWSADGNADGRADPNNVYDASLAAAHYLCSGGGDLRTGAGLTNAILSYNHSAQYVDLVLHWMQTYAGGSVPIPDQIGGSWEDGGFTPPASAGQDESVSAAPPVQPPQAAPAPEPASPAPKPAPPTAGPKPAPKPTPAPAKPALPVVGPALAPVVPAAQHALAPLTAPITNLVPVPAISQTVGSLLP